jgi:DNA-binding transcriptional ArsR family regulator
MDVQTQRALAHPKRIEILGYLMRKGGADGTDGSELVDSLDLARAKVRYHLAVLGHADLISHTDDRDPSPAGRYIAAAPAGK